MPNPNELEKLGFELERVILDNGTRGMSQLYAHLGRGSLMEAARGIAAHSGTALIATGFYIIAAGTAETDGPPGAAHIGSALRALGITPVFVTEEAFVSIVQAAAGEGKVVGFPMLPKSQSKTWAKNLRVELNDPLLISIERAGIQPDGTYRNMRWRDISEHTAYIDALFEDSPSICIGDGGNEIGMGLLAKEIEAELGLESAPVTTAEHLVLGTTSNWAGYGLVAALSAVVRKDLLPDDAEAERAIRDAVRAGAVDGVTGEQTVTVDGFPLALDIAVLGRLRRLVLDYLAD